MGRPRKTIEASTRKVSKEDKAARMAAEKKLKLGSDQLAVPDWLQSDAIAAEEFKRVVEEYKKIDTLDNLDLSTLAIYCKAYSSYIEVTRLIEVSGYVAATADGSAKISPYVTAQDRYVTQIFRCSAKLGLATTDRLKLVVGVDDGKADNKFLPFLE